MIHSPNGKFLAFGSCEGQVGIIKLDNLSVYADLIRHDTLVKTITFTNDSKYVLTGTPEMNVDILKNERTYSKFQKNMYNANFRYI